MGFKQTTSSLWGEDLIVFTMILYEYIDEKINAGSAE
jgi:hypothetical protein